MDRSYTEEIEELLLDCYISTIIKTAKKELQPSKQMKVHFGSQLHVSFQEYNLEFSGSQFDDTLPIDVQCPNDLSMDSILSLEDYDECEFQDGLWSEKKDCGNGFIDNSPLHVESYEDFLKGAQKRLYVHDQSDDTFTSSPRCKKTKQDAPTDDTIGVQSSTPDESYENRPQVQDTLMFLKYRVMSFALNKHKKLLNQEGNEANPTIPRFPSSSSNNVAFFWNMCSSPDLCDETKNKHLSQEELSAMESDKCELSPPVLSSGVKLARDILKKEAEKENIYIPIRHFSSINDFESRSSYKKFLYEHGQTENLHPQLKLNQNALLPEGLNEVHPQMPTREEVNLYLMPETAEAVGQEDENHEKGRNLVAQQMENLQQQEQSLDDHCPQLSKQIFRLEEYNDDCFDREQKFQRALALTQDDIDASFYEEERASENEIEEHHWTLPYQNGDVDEDLYKENVVNVEESVDREESKQSYIDEIFLTQTQSSVHEMDSKEANEFSVNRMLSELMASQAIMGTQQHQQQQRYRYNMRTYENKYENEDNDGVVPQFEEETWSNGDVMFHEDGGEKRKENAAKYKQDPQTPTVPDNKKNAVFKWNQRNEDDSVVPCLGDIYNSPITTPQKLKLGLSKKLKVKRTLHPYRK